MINYKDFTIFLGSYLTDINFQKFLNDNFNDLSEYNIFDGYISSELTAIELGFKNEDAIYDDDTEQIFEKGNPFFSHFNLYAKSGYLINQFPFGITFNDGRNEVLKKAGIPVQTRKGYNDLLGKNFINDTYKIDYIAITFEYEPNTEKLILIQVRDNNSFGDLKL